MELYEHRTLIWCGLVRFLHYGNIQKYRAMLATGGGRKRKWKNGDSWQYKYFPLLPFFIDPGIR